jgi:hypothetical protein
VKRIAATWIDVVAPAVTDDRAADQRKTVGDRWVNALTGKTYTCTDDTAGAAVWVEEDGAGGGGGGGVTSHPALTSLGWTVSGHTGTANTLAGFGGAGAATAVALPLSLSNGGTGASGAPAARTALGLAIGTDVLAYDAGLTSLTGVDTAADLLPYTTAANTWASTAFQAFGRTLVGAANAAAARSTLNLVVGTNVQGWDAGLDALAVFASTGIVVATGTDTWTARTITGGTGLTVSNGSGVAGNPTLTLAAGLQALASQAAGIAVCDGAGGWVARTLTGPADGITVTNGSGVSGNPTLALANDLGALEGLATTGLGARTAVDTWATRSLAVVGAGLAVTNADGVAGNPTITITPTAVVDAVSPFRASQTLSANFTLAAGRTDVAVDVLAISAGVTLTLGAGATLRVL